MKQLLLIAGLALSALCANAQKQKIPVKEPISPPLIIETPVDTRLKNTKWSMTIDTSREKMALLFERITGNAPVACLIHFIDEKRFRMTVRTKACSFKADGTYSLNFVPPPEGEAVTMSYGRLSFNRYNNQSSCAERLKKRIGSDYLSVSYEEQRFRLEEDHPELISLPPGQ